ncbi:MAG: nucleotidyltransferase family protein [Pirellulales bacterium]
MARADVLRNLREHRDELRERYAVRSLALFGSVARDDADEGSDVDLLVEFDQPVGLLHVIGTEQHLQAVLRVSKVDLVLRDDIIPELKDRILSEAIDVFGPADSRHS